MLYKNPDSLLEKDSIFSFGLIFLALKTSSQVTKTPITDPKTKQKSVQLDPPQFGKKGYGRFIGRGLAGGIAGSVPGILAGKLMNQALARSENNKQPPMHPYQ